MSYQSEFHQLYSESQPSLLKDLLLVVISCEISQLKDLILMLHLSNIKNFRSSRCGSAVTNPTSVLDASLIPGPAQGSKDPALLCAVV